MELIFEIRDAEEGGFYARALGHAIFTEADDWDRLKFPRGVPTERLIRVLEQLGYETATQGKLQGTVLEVAQQRAITGDAMIRMFE